jgi:hypothetical protein
MENVGGLNTTIAGIATRTGISIAGIAGKEMALPDCDTTGVLASACGADGSIE